MQQWRHKRKSRNALASPIYGGGDRFSGGKGPRQRHIKLIAAGDTSPL